MTILISSIAVFVTACSITINANDFRPWNKDSFEQSFFDIREDCTSGSCLSMFPDKRSVELEEVGDKPWPVSRMIGSYRVTNRPFQISCPCETRYDIIDLGLENYPRYLTTAHCNLKACHNKFNQCKLIRYKVHILRQRDTSIGNEASEEQTYVEQTMLPESLRMKWQMKPMKIPVACVAGEAKKN